MYGQTGAGTATLHPGGSHKKSQRPVDYRREPLFFRIPTKQPLPSRTRYVVPAPVASLKPKGVSPRNLPKPPRTPVSTTSRDSLSIPRLPTPPGIAKPNSISPIASRTPSPKLVVQHKSLFVPSADSSSQGKRSERQQYAKEGVVCKAGTSGPFAPASCTRYGACTDLVESAEHNGFGTSGSTESATKFDTVVEKVSDAFGVWCQQSGASELWAKNDETRNNGVAASRNTETESVETCYDEPVLCFPSGENSVANCKRLRGGGIFTGNVVVSSRTASHATSNNPRTTVQNNEEGLVGCYVQKENELLSALEKISCMLKQTKQLGSTASQWGTPGVAQELVAEIARITSSCARPIPNRQSSSPTGSLSVRALMEAKVAKSLLRVVDGKQRRASASVTFQDTALRGVPGFKDAYLSTILGESNVASVKRLCRARASAERADVVYPCPKPADHSPVFVEGGARSAYRYRKSIESAVNPQEGGVPLDKNVASGNPCVSSCFSGEQHVRTGYEEVRGASRSCVSNGCMGEELRDRMGSKKFLGCSKDEKNDSVVPRFKNDRYEMAAHANALTQTKQESSKGENMAHVCLVEGKNTTAFSRAPLRLKVMTDDAYCLNEQCGAPGGQASMYRTGGKKVQNVSPKTFMSLSNLMMKDTQEVSNEKVKSIWRASEPPSEGVKAVCENLSNSRSFQSSLSPCSLMSPKDLERLCRTSSS
ncbi:hypothetical protein TRVL_08399 [Trypanosoma vivax]|nr:hypothetical protein TRVL_08399 [Trypanosoma vivax]